MKKYFYIWLACLMSLAFASGIHASEKCIGKNTQEISGVFAKAIDLNEAFKKAATGKDDEAYRSLRTKVERYGEDTAFPCVIKTSKILSNHNNPALMRQFLKLVVSFENSADETISSSLGTIFAYNPSAIERGIKDFPDAQRELIAKSVQVGWENSKKGLGASRIADRDKRIKRLISN